jgi:hypothetical protein
MSHSNATGFFLPIFIIQFTGARMLFLYFVLISKVIAWRQQYLFKMLKYENAGKCIELFFAVLRCGAASFLYGASSAFYVFKTNKVLKMFSIDFVRLIL